MTKKKILKIAVLASSFLVLPLLAFAAADDFIFGKPGGVTQTPKDFKSMICIVIMLCLDFIPYIVVIAVGAFLTGLIRYVGNGDNEEKRSEGRKLMIYGIVGFFFIVSVWGILQIFVGSFNQKLVIPQFKSGGVSFSDSCKK